MHINLHNMKVKKSGFHLAVTYPFSFHCDLENSNTELHYLFEDINPFPVNVPFMYPFQKITDVFMGYRNETLAGDRLKRHTYIIMLQY